MPPKTYGVSELGFWLDTTTPNSLLSIDSVVEVQGEITVRIQFAGRESLEEISMEFGQPSNTHIVSWYIHFIS